ncbi:hypothetical protein CYMTET_26224, partial [Cymbomonas tetramitiformis]
TVYDHIQKRVDTQRAAENLELLKQVRACPRRPRPAACREVKLKKDHVIIQQNHITSHVYCIAQGQCQVCCIVEGQIWASATCRIDIGSSQEAAALPGSSSALLPQGEEAEAWSLCYSCSTEPLECRGEAARRTVSPPQGSSVVRSSTAAEVLRASELQRGGGLRSAGFSGEALPRAQTQRGRSLLVAEYGQHQVLGLLPVLTEEPPPSSMVCSTDCTLLAISATSLSEILEADQQYMQRLIQLVPLPSISPCGHSPSRSRPSHAALDPPSVFVQGFPGARSSEGKGTEALTRAADAANQRKESLWADLQPHKLAPFGTLTLGFQEASCHEGSEAALVGGIRRGRGRGPQGQHQNDAHRQRLQRSMAMQQYALAPARPLSMQIEKDGLLWAIRATRIAVLIGGAVETMGYFGPSTVFDSEDSRPGFVDGAAVYPLDQPSPLHPPLAPARLLLQYLGEVDEGPGANLHHWSEAASLGLKQRPLSKAEAPLEGRDPSQRQGPLRDATALVMCGYEVFVLPEGSGNEVEYDEEEEEDLETRACPTAEELRAEVGLTKTVHLGGCAVHRVQHCKEEKELDLAWVKMAQDLDHLAVRAQVRTDPRTDSVLAVEVPVVVPSPPIPPPMAAQRQMQPPSGHRLLVSTGNTGAPPSSARDPHRRPSFDHPSDLANPTSRALQAPIVPRLKLPSRGRLFKEESLAGTMSARASTIEPWSSHSGGASTSRSRTIERSTSEEYAPLTRHPEANMPTRRWDTLALRRSKELRLREEPNGRILIPRFNHVSNFKRRHLPGTHHARAPAMISSLRGEAPQHDLHIKLPSKDSTRECRTPLDGGPLHPLYGPEMIPVERSFSSPAPPLLGVDLKCTRRGATLPILIDNGKHGPQHRATKKGASATATLRKMCAFRQALGPPSALPCPPASLASSLRDLWRRPPEKYASWMDRQQKANQKGEEDAYDNRDGIQIGLYHGGFSSKSCEFEGGFYNEGTMYF